VTMEIVRDLQDLIPPSEGSVTTIGNFDGVHLGHREIFRRVVGVARTRGSRAVVCSFVPHPLKLLAPQKAPPLINTYEEKERLIEASCIDLLVCIPFTREMATLTPDQFVREVLIDHLNTKHLVIGYDYAFGRNRAGNASFLQKQGKYFGFTVETLGPISGPKGAYSSSRIREMVEAGNVAEVIELLGRNFTLEGTVVHGAGRGVGLGFPTANLVSDKELLPGEGVYAVKVRWRDNLLDGVANVGRNPTFGGDRTGVEVHLLDRSGDFYGEKMRIYFVERLRDEIRFSSLADLAQAISADVERAGRILRDTKIVEYREYLDCGHQVPAPEERGRE